MLAIKPGISILVPPFHARMGALNKVNCANKTRAAERLRVGPGFRSSPRVQGNDTGTWTWIINMMSASKTRTRAGQTTSMIISHRFPFRSVPRESEQN